MRQYILILLMLLVGLIITLQYADEIDAYDPYQPAPKAFEGLTPQEIQNKERELEATKDIDRQFQEQEVSRGTERNKTMVFEVTAYTHTGNLTASQTYPRRGTIAADTSVLPFGTRVYIPGYGFGVVEDTGSDIQGLRLDLFMENESECWQWGRQTLEVEILN